MNSLLLTVLAVGTLVKIIHALELGLPTVPPVSVPVSNLNFKAPEPSTNRETLDGGDQCVPVPQCDSNAPWRSLDGSCNNLIFPMWGQAHTALTRLAKADYSDGEHEPRKSQSGKELPNARSIVTEAFSFAEAPDFLNTLALMSVGQLISHDVSLIDAPADPPRTCCNVGGKQCMNINVPPRDPFYRDFNVSCLPMERAGTTASLSCPLKPEYTLTTVSHFVDASFIYGSEEKTLARLREGTGGRLKSIQRNGRPYPPQRQNPKQICHLDQDDELCMDAGDVRNNQNPPLASLQIIFFREHNRIADELAKLNPQWDDERLLQEARRILIAEWQIVVYRDWLPYIIGHETAKVEKLVPIDSGMSSDYDQFFNPSTTNDFTSAAYRVFHSQIPSAYCAQGASDKALGCPFGANDFSKSFEHPEILGVEGGLDSVLFGLDRQNMERTDSKFTKEISGKLFRFEKPWGSDLIATDIQRGRDVGLPPYNKYRSLCGLRAVRRWNQLIDVIDLKDISRLMRIYDRPDDVDLYVAGVLEKKMARSMVGPTFQCIIVDQFKRWKRGDRYFYDLEGFPHSLRPEQVNALRSASLPRLLCDNSDNMKTVSKDTFLLESKKVPCENIPKVDLSPWKEA